MKTITVFTPTFNRAYCLHQLYESLCRQTSQDFIWLVIDDGSSDNTKHLVQTWIKQNKIPISYVYKENGGMHTGHNTALSLIETELNVCIDSDDYLTDNAVEIICDFWKTNKNEQYAGILGLNSFKNGKLVTNKEFPENVKGGKYVHLKNKYGIVNDVKFVYATEVIKKYKNYPTFKNENFVPLGYKYAIIDQDYDMLFLNEVLCIVEYMEDGSSLNMYKQYYRNPKGFAHSRRESFIDLYSLKEQYIKAVHLVAESILSKENAFKNNSKKFLTLLALPLGLALYANIVRYNKKIRR